MVAGHELTHGFDINGIGFLFFIVTKTDNHGL
jgi:hypothetical protein